MEKPKKEDFEYYQNGLAFKTVNLIEYTKALELYINELEALILPVVVRQSEQLCDCKVPIIRTGKNGIDYCGWCDYNIS